MADQPLYQEHFRTLAAMKPPRIMRAFAWMVVIGIAIRVARAILLTVLIIGLVLSSPIGRPQDPPLADEERVPRLTVAHCAVRHAVSFFRGIGRK